jgi:hypothetical protein
MPGRVFSGPEVQPAEVTARVAPAGVTAGRVRATKVATSRVAASASALRLCGREETDHGERDQKDTQRPHKEGSSSGHGLPTLGNVVPVYSGSRAREYVTFSSQTVSFLLELTLGAGVHRLPVEAIDEASPMLQFQGTTVRSGPSRLLATA